MLAHEYSLKGTKKIEKLLKKGNIIQSENFGVSIIKRNDQELPKFAFVVSKKIAKLAVHRNRIKRALNETIRRNVNMVPKGYDVIFLAKRDIVKKTTDEIMREVEKFLDGKHFKL